MGAAVLQKLTSFFKTDIVEKFERFARIGPGLQYTADSIKSFSFEVKNFSIDMLHSLADNLKYLYDQAGRNVVVKDLAKAIGLTDNSSFLLLKGATAFKAIAASAVLLVATLSPNALTNLDKFSEFGTSKNFVATVENFSALNNSLQGIHKVANGSTEITLRVSSEFVDALEKLMELELKIQQQQLEELVKNNNKMDKLIDLTMQTQVPGGVAFTPIQSNSPSMGSYASTQSSTRNAFLESSLRDNNSLVATYIIKT